MDVVVFVDVDVGMDVDGHTAAVFDVGVFVHVCVDEEVVGGRRGRMGCETYLVKTVMGKNSDDVYSPSCARPRRRHTCGLRHRHT